MLEPEHRNQKGTQIIKFWLSKLTVTRIVTFKFVNISVPLYHFLSLYFLVLNKTKAKFENKKLVKALPEKLI